MARQSANYSGSEIRKRQAENRALSRIPISLLLSALLITPSTQSAPHVRMLQTPKEARSSKTEMDFPSLKQGEPIKSELAGGQQHSYQIRLNGDQFLKVVVKQDGIDTVVKLIKPDGKQIIEFDGDRSTKGQENVSWAAEEPGIYRLEVAAKYKNAAVGQYEIQVVEQRLATENDRALHEARKINTEYAKLFRAGHYYEAVPLVERVVAICEKVLGPEHLGFASALFNLASLYSEIGEYAKAEPLFQRALTSMEKSLKPENPIIAATLNNLAGLYKTTGDYAKAESYYERALAIREKAQGAEHPDVAASFNNLANLYSDTGDYAKAESYYRRALTIGEKALGQEHTDVASALNNLANLHRAKGEYAKAEPLYSRALAIYEKALGSDHPVVAKFLTNIANLYRAKGDSAKAEPLYERSLSIMEKAMGQEHPDVARILNNLASIYSTRKGDYAKAELYYGRALSIRERALGPEHPDVARVLFNLAELNVTKDDYPKAELLYERTLNIWVRAHGPEHPEVANTLSSLAALFTKKGDFAIAEPLAHSALSIGEKSLGPDHPDIADYLSNLAVLYAAKGDIGRAVAFQARATSIDERNFALNLATGSERQKLAYLAGFSKRTDFTLTLHNKAAPNDPQALDLAFTTMLRRKARGLDAMTDTIATFRRHATSEDKELFDRLTNSRSQLAALKLKETDDAKPEINPERLKPLEEVVDKLEGELSARSAGFRAQTQPVTIAAVRAALPANSALIEFVVYTPQKLPTLKGEPARYIAYLLAPSGQPRWVDLGEAAPIDKAVDGWRQALRGNRIDVKRLAREVDEMIMRPIRSSLQSELGEIGRLLIAPDGSLNLVPFAALVDEQNQYLIERYTISYLTSGRDLLRLQDSPPEQGVPLVVADPLFGATFAAERGAQRSGTSPSVRRAGRQIDPGQTGQLGQSGQTGQSGQGRDRFPAAAGDEGRSPGDQGSHPGSCGFPATGGYRSCAQTSTGAAHLTHSYTRVLLQRSTSPTNRDERHF